MPGQLFSQHYKVSLMKKIKPRKTINGGKSTPAGIPAKTNLPVYQGAGDILTKLSGHFKGCHSSIERSQAMVSA